MVATSVANDDARRLGGGAGETGMLAAGSDALAAIVEDQIQELAHQGTDESALRQLVGEAVRLGRTLAGTGP
jgi:hypothetical protein